MSRPTMLLMPESPERAVIMQAIGLVNQAIRKLGDDACTDSALSVDVRGCDHLYRARGDLIRALAPPAQRESEVGEAFEYLRTPGGHDGETRRPMEANLLEQRWATSEYSDDLPGSFYLEPGTLDRLGIDPEIEVKP